MSKKENDVFGFQDAINYDNLDHMTGDTLNELAKIFQLEDYEISNIADNIDKEVEEWEIIKSLFISLLIGFL